VHGFSAFLVDAISSILIVPWNVIAPSSSCQPFSDSDWIGQTISAHGLYSYLFPSWLLFAMTRYLTDHMF